VPGNVAPVLGFDSRIGGVPPFDPRAVVDPHILISEEVLEREPRLARLVADRAIGDHSLLVSNPSLLEYAAQLLGTLEAPALGA
jgi:hypothetical protein